MPMYNLFEYSKSYRKTAGSLWNYLEINLIILLLILLSVITLLLLIIMQIPITNSASFKYKNSITGKTLDNDNDNDENDNRKKEDVEILCAIKIFKQILENIPVINCDITVVLVWSKNYF